MWRSQFLCKKNPTHPIQLFLEKENVVQLVNDPTHIEGGVLDMCM